MDFLRYLPVSLALLTAPALADKGPKPPKPPPQPKVRPNPRPQNLQIDKLSQLSPAERERVLSSVPPERRQRLEAGLERWKNLTPEQRQRQTDKLEKLHSLPVEQQRQIRQFSQRIQALPDDRKTAVRRELVVLQKMPLEDRDKRVNSPGFQKKFTPEEQDILRQYPALLPEHYF